MFKELDMWVDATIAEDIFLPSRSEFHPYIKRCQALQIKKEHIPAVVLGILLAENDAEKKSFMFRFKELIESVYKRKK